MNKESLFQKINIETAFFKSCMLTKGLFLQQDVDAFWESPSGSLFYGFICRLNESVQQLPRKANKAYPNSTNTTILAIDELLSKLQHSIDEFPINKVSNRFGNPAFRDWLQIGAKPIIVNCIDALPIQDLRLTSLGAQDDAEDSCIEAAVIRQEMLGYLMDSFGNSQRIDYGTGHELHFMAFLYCVVVATGISEDEYSTLILSIFSSYLALMRKLQMTYWLEPAGSQGVWGLDDYHFLPFLFGSSQLSEHPHFRPKSIHIKENLEGFSQEFMYFECIKFIHEMKSKDKVFDGIGTDQRTGLASPLRWHSPMLDDISAVKSWRKVNQGLLKMYWDNVLHKLPIMQHFLMGHMLSFNSSSSNTSAAPPPEDAAACRCKPSNVTTIHGIPLNMDPVGTELSEHTKEQHGDCCGIRIPSVHATRIPFD